MKKVLIIENDLDTLEILGCIFEGINFIPLESQFRVPIDNIIKENPDLIVLDYYLDDCCGSEICAELKSNLLTKNISVIILSTARYPSDFERLPR